MKQVTLNLDDATFHSAEDKAQRRGKSLPALMLEWLRSFAAEPESDFDRLAKEELAVRETIRQRGARFSAADRLTRDELHARHALR